MTTDTKSRYQDILERLSKATGPDRELDRDIVYALGGDFRGAGKWMTFDKREPYDCRRANVTDSLDATIALIERVLPDANCNGFDQTPKVIAAYVSRNCVPRPNHWYYEGEHKTSIALAFLIALFHALEAKEKQG